MILLLSDTITPRLQYIADFIFKENFGVNYNITTDKKEFEEKDAIKINYTEDKYAGNVINVNGSRLLFERKIYKQAIETFEKDGLIAFFKNERGPGNFAFDIFAATFYLLSRYEEYLPHTKDEYGRYDHRQSLAATAGFLRIPLINKWLDSFAEFIRNNFPSFQTKKKDFKFLPTYDVDMAFEWRGKGLLRNTGQMLRLIFQNESKKIKEGFRILRGTMRDPADNFESFKILHGQLKLEPTYFFLVAKENTKYDKNISPFDSEMKSLIRWISKTNETGVHPSYYSLQNEKTLKEEKFLLEEITGNIIQKSRQHYLRFNLPGTYRQLAATGIKDEFSMGYGAANGFRASYAGSFHWYDIEREEKTNLMLHPFCYMDSNAIFHQNLTAAESFEELMYFYKACKDVNGTFICVMHNHLMSSDYSGWKNAYEKFLLDVNKQVNV